MDITDWKLFQITTESVQHFLCWCPTLRAKHLDSLRRNKSKIQIIKHPFFCHRKYIDGNTTPTISKRFNGIITSTTSTHITERNTDGLSIWPPLLLTKWHIFIIIKNMLRINSPHYNNVSTLIAENVADQIVPNFDTFIDIYVIFMQRHRTQKRVCCNLDSDNVVNKKKSNTNLSFHGE